KWESRSSYGQTVLARRSYETPATHDWNNGFAPARARGGRRPGGASVLRLVGARPLTEPVSDARGWGPEGARRPGPAAAAAPGHAHGGPTGQHPEGHPDLREGHSATLDDRHDRGRW